MDDQQGLPIDYRAGDVLLVRGTTSKSQVLVNSQKLLYTKARSSHVLLGLGDGTFIHATGDGGVHLTFLLDELAQVQDDWRVVRLASLTPEQRNALQVAGLHFLRQGYNKKFFGPEQENSSFCSELVAKAFRKADVEIFDGKRAGMVTPASFDRAADSRGNWLDVSSMYRNQLSTFTAREKMYRFGLGVIEQSLARRHVISGMRNMAMNMLVELAAEEDRANKQALMDKHRQYLRKNRALSFWDED